MSLTTILSLGQTALELGLICSLTVLALFLSYLMLNVCDLSTDGCFTFGAAVGAMTAVSGHPFLSIPAAMAAGVCSGFVTAILQTKMGVESLLAGIIVNTGLYSINIAVMGNSSLVNMNSTTTVFTMLKDFLAGTPLANYYKLIIALAAVALVITFLGLFLRTRLGLAIRATGNNPDMVRSSSINPAFTTTVGLCISNSFTALSGCLLGQSQKSVNIDIGSGMLTVALASLLIGATFLGKGGIVRRAIGVVIGAIIFRLVYTIALRFNMPASMLKLVSSVIVIIAISAPYFKSQWPLIKRRMTHKTAAPAPAAPAAPAQTAPAEATDAVLTAKTEAAAAQKVTASKEETTTEEAKATPAVGTKKDKVKEETAPTAHAGKDKTNEEPGAPADPGKGGEE